MIQSRRTLTQRFCRILKGRAIRITHRCYLTNRLDIPFVTTLSPPLLPSLRHSGQASIRRWVSKQADSEGSAMAPHIQDQVQSHSLEDPESFWAHQAEQLYWHKKPSQILKKTTKNLPSGVSHSHWTWFPDGELSTCYNCIDRHVKNGHGDLTAIIWDSPVTGTKEKYTYKQLLIEVETLAGVLREEGVKKGDVVLVYSKLLRRIKL